MKISLFYLTSLAAALPSASLGKRQVQELCDQYEYWCGNGYEVNNNLWGQDSGTGGQQSTTIDNIEGDELAWHTAWTWAGGEYEVKSYANVVPTIEPTKISALSSIPASWDWRYVS